ncbi:hypothetical protein P152DRAFT_14488 [Eremomyces bilateralis CBS 781.70]|uniref:Uncharacterized protein n=1 Tax=Eremomyces bilateralis CBS 781.70 TaxID=1392243 RepID=A0A6G1GH75_9PEZI|nr:uncharacterized protein P152DRAFT_14488 [Eremomyces bilateralis CBS 781.70]KAF1817286.1 hypothetical protein P152DRAFT_14488 [Eremomyces bilateralis CBS 781.70]
MLIRKRNITHHCTRRFKYSPLPLRYRIITGFPPLISVHSTSTTQFPPPQKSHSPCLDRSTQYEPPNERISATQPRQTIFNAMKHTKRPSSQCAGGE